MKSYNLLTCYTCLGSLLGIAVIFQIQMDAVGVSQSKYDAVVSTIQF